MTINQCPKFLLLCHSMYAKARETECVCPPEVGCNYVDPRTCKACGFLNTWRDSGDRGAANADHDAHCAEWAVKGEWTRK